MMMNKAKRLVPYELTEPGWEALYTGERREAPDDTTDAQGNVLERWSTWAFVWDGEKEWSDSDEEIVYINKMQEKLGELDDDTRQIRAHIGSFVPCDSGVPVTIDELLMAIGSGKIVGSPFHNGCWVPNMWWQSRMSQPGQPEAMTVIQTILQRYLDGKPKQDSIQEFPYARLFATRTYEWLGARSKLTDLQVLLLRKLLVPFALWSRMSIGAQVDWSEKAPILEDIEHQGAEIDAEIQKLGESPPQGMPHKYPVCDCHHNTFRNIERWIYRIGIGDDDIPTRKKGTERERIGRLSFGYSLALDKWLLGVPMQFLLLDLGHVDLGFDPKNEILRTYAYLGEERTPVKEWLAACLWYTITYNHIFIVPDYKVALGRAHKGLIDRATKAGISIREWADSALGKEPDYR